MFNLTAALVARAIASTTALTHSPASVESGASISTARPSRACSTIRADAGSCPLAAAAARLAVLLSARGFETVASRRSILAVGDIAARCPSMNIQSRPRCNTAMTGEKVPVTPERRVKQPIASSGKCTSRRTLSAVAVLGVAKWAIEGGRAHAACSGAGTAPMHRTNSSMYIYVSMDISVDMDCCARVVSRAVL